MPLAVEIQDASPGVAGHGEGDQAGEDDGLVGGGDDVGGEGGGVPVGVVNPDPGAEVPGVALGVGDVVSVGEQHVVDPPGVLDRPGEGAVPVRGVDEERVPGLGDEPGVGAEGAKVIVPAEEHARSDVHREDPGRGGAMAGVSASWIQHVLWVLVYRGCEDADRGELPRHGITATVIRTLENGIHVR